MNAMYARCSLPLSLSLCVCAKAAEQSKVAGGITNMELYYSLSFEWNESATTVRHQADRESKRVQGGGRSNSRLSWLHHSLQFSPNISWRSTNGCWRSRKRLFLRVFHFNWATRRNGWCTHCIQWQQSCVHPKNKKKMPIAFMCSVLLCDCIGYSLIQK